MSEENNKALQQKYLELQLLEQQIKEVQQQQQILNHRLNELIKLNESLTDLEKFKENQKLFAQIGPSVFIKTELKDSKNVLMDVGSGVIVEKPISEAIKLISTQLKEIENNLGLITQHLSNAAMQAQTFQEELQQLQASSKK